VTSTEFSDQRAVVSLKQDLIAAVERAYALAWAIARLEGCNVPQLTGGAAREYIISTLDQVDVSSKPFIGEMEARRSRVSSPQGPVPRAAPSPPRGPSPQELILETLRADGASVRDLQIVLEDHGLDVSPGNLSVILSRMYQAGIIDRAGRGLYSLARSGYAPAAERGE